MGQINTGPGLCLLFNTVCYFYHSICLSTHSLTYLMYPSIRLFVKHIRFHHIIQNPSWEHVLLKSLLLTEFVMTRLIVCYFYRSNNCYFHSVNVCANITRLNLYFPPDQISYERTIWQHGELYDANLALSERGSQASQRSPGMYKALAVKLHYRSIMINESLFIIFLETMSIISLFFKPIKWFVRFRIKSLDEMIWSFYFYH